MTNQLVQAIDIHCPACGTDTLTKQCYGCGSKVCVYCGFMQVTQWFCADCWYNGYEEPYHQKVQQAWDALQATPDYARRFQCYHAGLAGFFQAIAILASQEVDPLTLDWEEANEWRELQDKWELIGEPS